MNLFPKSETMDFPALLFMMCVYGYVLMTGSQIISQGSEMLLLIYGPGIIGGLIIPILGAIPDCAIILISGLGKGTQEEIQQELSVGVGTLVGSTIMLLTIPWAVGIYLGRRDLDISKGTALTPAKGQPKVSHFSLTTNVVSVVNEIPATAKIMMISTLSYLIIQIPAFFFKNTSDSGVQEEAPYALTGVIVTFLAFAAYCYMQVTSAVREEMTKLQTKALKREEWKKGLDRKLGSTEYQEFLFKKHDKDNSGHMNLQEFKLVMDELGFRGDREDIEKFFKEADTGIDGKGRGDGRITLGEFKQAISSWIKHDSFDKKSKVYNLEESNHQQARLLIEKNDEEDHHEEGEEEEEEEEENYWHLTNMQLKLKALGLLLLGTAICTIFSDPMVDIISNVGLKMKISPFYVSFVVTPLASNASEVIAGLLFARKKTTDSISLTLSTLHGAATMNSTLSLCIFMCLIYFRQLSWAFTAEVMTVMLVVIIVGLNGLRTTIYLWQGILVASLYPLSILMVYIMENVFGLD